MKEIEAKVDSANRYKKITKRSYDGGNSFLKEYYYNYKETKGWTYKTKRTGIDTDMFFYWWRNYFLDPRDYERNTPNGFRMIDNSKSHGDMEK